MSRYRKVDPRIWNDAKFRTLNNHGKLLFFFLLTHPHMTALGAFRATPAGLCEELAWQPEAFRKAFADVLSRGMAEHDAEACLIALPNFIRYNTPESPNVIKAWSGALDLLPECDLKNRVLQRAGAIVQGMSDGFREAFQEAFPKAMPNQEPEPKQKPKKKTPPPPSGGSERFPEFWSAWPAHVRKVAREQCERKWKTKLCDPIADVVLAALRQQISSPKWREEGGKFIPSPLVWLNQARWEAPSAEDAAQANWTETRSGIEGKGQALNLGKWDQRAFELGQGEPFAAYMARVFKAAGVELRAA